MIGALIGYIVGSRFERHNIKTKEFELFDDYCKATDDSVMTLALAAAILYSKEDRSNLSEKAVYCMRKFGHEYPHAGYGGLFKGWLEMKDPKPYGSMGNGAAMRVSSCRWAAESLEEAKLMSRLVTEVTHDSEDGLRGAEATTVAIYMALHGRTKEEIGEVFKRDYYKIDFTLDDIRPSYKWGGKCHDTVPYAMEAFLESESFEDAIRNAISIGGDSDTLRAITGSVAEAYYGVPVDIREEAMDFLDELMEDTLYQFESKYGQKDA
ncbi:MAG: ADP-ribosylglycohydrolase family protein [Oscillospiraceae bacterium]|nr:ADP-ribosylglycohydrolase family protein [Oscillospiraceae bacterium]